MLELGQTRRGLFRAQVTPGISDVQTSCGFFRATLRIAAGCAEETLAYLLVSVAWGCLDEPDIAPASEFINQVLTISRSLIGGRRVSGRCHRGWPPGRARADP